MRALLFEIAWPKWAELERLGCPVFTIDAEFTHPKLGMVRVHQPAPTIWKSNSCPGELVVELVDTAKLERLREIEKLPMRERVDCLNAEFRT